LFFVTSLGVVLLAYKKFKLAICLDSILVFLWPMDICETAMGEKNYFRNALWPRVLKSADQP